jgi:hypothetical protein
MSPDRPDINGLSNFKSDARSIVESLKTKILIDNYKIDIEEGGLRG